jgi:hypothetical protein
MNRTDRVKPAHSLDKPRPGITVRVGNREWMIPTSNNQAETEANVHSAMPRAEERDETVTAGEPAWTKRIPPSLLRPVEDVLSADSEPQAYRSQHSNKRTVHPSVTRSRVRQRARRLRETFQFGCVFGLLLGCLSMILFHQMEPNLSSDVRSAATDSAVLSTSMHSFDLPAVKVQILQSKPFGNRSDADRQVASLNQHGLPAVVHQQGRQFVIWTAAAVKAVHLKKWASASNGVAVQAVPLNLSVQSIPALSGSNPKSLADVSNWLSLSAAALNTLTAVESDGGLPEDAYTAYDSARQQLPGSDILAETGKGDLLKQFSRELDTAFSAYRKQQTQEAMRHTLLAYDLLSRLHL